jgi:DNA-directed RNA polymerase specialized sigma24 family protein
MSSQSDATAFDRLLQALEPEALSVGEGFRRCRTKLVRFFLWKRCDDPYNLADETTSRLVKKVQSGQEISADHPYNYVYAIARNVFHEYLRAKERSGTAIDIDELREEPVPEGTEDCWSQCLAQMSPEKREFLEVYYLDSIDREQFAHEKGMTINALRLTVFRYKSALKHCVENCLRRFNSGRN